MASRSFTMAALMGFALLSGSAAYSQTPAPANPAETAFKTNCVMCHGSDGSGTTLGKQMGAPDLRSKPVQDLTPAAMAKIITEGKNNMPPFGARMDSTQIHALVEYIRKFHPAPAAPADTK